MLLSVQNSELVIGTDASLGTNVPVHEAFSANDSSPDEARQRHCTVQFSSIIR